MRLFLFLQVSLNLAWFNDWWWWQADDVSAYWGVRCAGGALLSSLHISQHVTTFPSTQAHCSRNNQPYVLTIYFLIFNVVRKLKILFYRKYAEFQWRCNISTSIQTLLSSIGLERNSIDSKESLYRLNVDPFNVRKSWHDDVKFRFWVSEERMSSIISGDSDHQYGIPGLGENRQKPSTYNKSVPALRVKLSYTIHHRTDQWKHPSKEQTDIIGPPVFFIVL